MKRPITFLAIYMIIVAIVAGGLAAIETDHLFDTSNTHIIYVTKPKLGPPTHITSKAGVTNAFPLTYWQKYDLNHHLPLVSYQGWKSVARYWQQNVEGRCGPVIKQSGYTTYFRNCTIKQSFHVTFNNPTPQPVPTITPTPQPNNNYASQCQSSNTNCELALLQLINSERASHNVPALQINWTESNGTTSCVGSKGHSIHMSQSGILAHDQFPADICVPFSTAGENIGEASGNEWQAIQQINTLMLQEPWSAGCNDNHHCNIDNPSYRNVGIGFAYGSGAWWLTTDFT